MREDSTVGMSARSSIIAAGLVASAIAVWLVFDSQGDDAPARTAAAVLVVSWSFIGAGLVALSRSSGRFGALMCAVGFAVYLAALSDADASVPFTAGLIVQSLWIGLLVHALLAFPTGRLATRASVAIAAATYVLVSVGQVVVL